MTAIADPIARAAAWLEEAKADHRIAEPTAMTLATVDATCAPHARMVLLKGLDARGFTFFTNSESAKGHELAGNPCAALCFYWMPLKRQMRVEGAVKKVSAEEADAYFASRHPESRLGAWASLQSQRLDAHETLLRRQEEARERFGDAIPRPPHWLGYRVIPQMIEFWEEGEFRLHVRERFIRAGGEWGMELLYP